MTPTRPDAEKKEYEQYGPDEMSSRQQHLYLLDGLLRTCKTMRTAVSYQVVPERRECDEAFDKPASKGDN